METKFMLGDIIHMHKRQKKSDIFISYRKINGGLEVANIIRDHFKSLNYTVFMDSHSIKLGEEFPTKIKDAIKSCKEVLLILPPDAIDEYGNASNALESEWVRFEIGYALQFNKTIIPILMLGYKFPKKDSYPELPEKFKKFPEINEKFRKINLKHGIELKNEPSDNYLEKLRKNLKSRPKWNIIKKILLPICITLLCLCILITSKCIYNLYLPLFSLTLALNENSDEKNSYPSWNMNYLITNKGGQLAGGKIIPSLRIGLKVVSKYQSYDYKYGFFDTKFYDFYEDSYFFDDQNNTVLIVESKADNLVNFITLMEEQLEKNDMYIQMYAIKTFFRIEYTDRLGLNHEEFYESENNYNYLLTGWGTKENQFNKEELVRYCSDNALVRVKKFDEALFSHPLFNNDSSQLAWDIKVNVKYVKKHQNKILKTNIPVIMEAEDDDRNAIDVPVEYMGNSVKLIEDDTGFVIGDHCTHDECIYKEDLKWYERAKRTINNILR